MNKDYLNYIFKELREGTVVESAIGYEFTTKDTVVSDEFNDNSFLSNTQLETQTKETLEHNESKILLQAESERSSLI